MHFLCRICEPSARKIERAQSNDDNTGSGTKDWKESEERCEKQMAKHSRVHSIVFKYEYSKEL